VALVFSVLGVLVAAALVVAASRGAFRLPAAIVVIAAVLGILAFGNNAWSLARGQLQARGINRTLPRDTINNAGGAIFPAREDILKIVDQQIPRQAKVFLVCGDPACSGGLNTWITFRLGPRVFTDRLGQAEWVLLYNSTARAARIDPSDLVDPRDIADRFTIAGTR
jgi:hypothetical protein